MQTVCSWVIFQALYMDHVNILLHHCHSQSIREGFVDRADGDIGPMCSSDLLTFFANLCHECQIFITNTYYYNQKQLSRFFF